MVSFGVCNALKNEKGGWGLNQNIFVDEWKRFCSGYGIKVVGHSYIVSVCFSLVLRWLRLLEQKNNDWWPKQQNLILLLF